MQKIHHRKNPTTTKLIKIRFSNNFFNVNKPILFFFGLSNATMHAGTLCRCVNACKALNFQLIWPVTSKVENCSCKQSKCRAVRKTSDRFWFGTKLHFLDRLFNSLNKNGQMKKKVEEKQNHRRPIYNENFCMNERKSQFNYFAWIFHGISSFSSLFFFVIFHNYLFVLLTLDAVGIIFSGNISNECIIA